MTTALAFGLAAVLFVAMIHRADYLLSVAARVGL